MKNVIAWMKSNPVTVLSALVIVLSLGFMSWVMFIASPALRTQAEEGAGKPLSRIRGYGSATVTVPPRNADDQPEVLSRVTINAKTIAVLKTIYQDLEQEAQGILDLALEINRENHLELVEGLFPDMPSDKRFTAKLAYEEALQALLGDAAFAADVAEKTGLTMPYLNAGLPLDEAVVQQIMDEKQAEFVQGQDISAFTPERLAQHLETQKSELRNLLLKHAQGISIYGQPELGPTRQPNGDFPLQVASLATISESPSASQLWEGQLELWVLQDVVQALMLANRVGEVREVQLANGTTQQKPYCVLDAPVKRLISAEVLSGYVGLHTLGGVTTGVSTGRATRAGGRGSTRVATGGEGYPPPAGGMTSPPRSTELADNFMFGPSSRASNGIFDVRHARLVVHADFQRLPELFNAISKVNLMTVLETKISQVDEYDGDVLGAFYVYGTGDIVEVELVIESLWLRSWTTPLMPEDVQMYLGLLKPKDEDLNGRGMPGGMPGMGPPGGYGMPGGDFY